MPDARRRTAPPQRRGPARRHDRRRAAPPSARPADPVAEALAIGLRHGADDVPGIRRRRAGKGWRFLAPDGTAVRDAATLARIRALAIPPAWRAVWINPDPCGHIQATGRDARGRKQYRYHPAWRQARDETKFGRLSAFAEALPAIRERVAADLGRRGVPRERTLATVVSLLDRSLMRVGNEEYARSNGSYGLTTLTAGHAEVAGTEVRFHFRGKHGKELAVGVRDRRVARVVGRLQDLPGEPLFQYLDEEGVPHRIDSGDVNAYLREIAGEGFTAKDFRTWGGTVLAAAALRAMPPPATGKAARGNVLQAVDRVAARLGNTRAVCRAAYIHPAVLDGYEAGDLSAFDPGPNGVPGLGDDEWFALAWLRRAGPRPPG